VLYAAVASSALVCSRAPLPPFPVSTLNGCFWCLLVLARRMANQWWPSNQSRHGLFPPSVSSSDLVRTKLSCALPLCTVSFTPSSSHATTTTATVTVRFQRIHSILSAISIPKPTIILCYCHCISNRQPFVCQALRFPPSWLIAWHPRLTAARDHLPY
jgi:hypothetical protein